MLFTLEDCTQFCYDHQRRYDKRGKFVGRTFEQWARLVIQAAREDNLVLAATGQELRGVLIRRLRYVSKMYDVGEIVCIKDGMRTFLQSERAKYPGWLVRGKRLNCNKTITYKPEKLWVATHQNQKA